MAVSGELEPSKGVLHLRPDQVLTMDEQERVDERLWSMFYHGPTVGVKCTYQNPELVHVKVDVAMVSSQTSHMDFERYLF